MTLELAREIWTARQRKRCPVEQPVSEWTGDFTLPPALGEYYKLVGPDELHCDDVTGLTLYLPSLRRLEGFQSGIFPPSTDSHTVRSWGPERLAVALHHTYPFIFESQAGTVSLHAPGSIRDAGWQPVATLDSLADMMIFFGLLDQAISEVDPYDEELDDQSPDFIPHLVETTSSKINPEVATTLVETMFA